MDEHNGHAFLLSSIFFFFCEWRVVFLLSTSHAECAWYVCVCVCALRGCRTAEAAVSSRHRKQSLCLCCVCSSWVCLIYDTEGICAPSNGDLIIFLCSFFSCRPRLRILKKNNLGESGLTMAYSTQPIHPSFQCNMQSSLASATSNIPEIFGRYIYNCTFHVDCSLWKWRSRCFAGKTSFCSLRPPVIRWFWLVWILFDVSAYITHCARACRCRPFALIAGGSV